MKPAITPTQKVPTGAPDSSERFGATIEVTGPDDQARTPPASRAGAPVGCRGTT